MVVGQLLIGVDTACKAFPSVVYESSHILIGAATVIDVGAGRGRFARYFLRGEYRSGRYGVRAPVEFSVTEYVAVEPYFCNELRKIRDPRLRVVCARWEDVREEYVNREFDMVILWNVLMFMPTDPYEVLKDMIHMARKFFLFSLYPVKSGTLPAEKFREVLLWLDTHPELEVVSKKYFNRVYRIRRWPE